MSELVTSRISVNVLFFGAARDVVSESPLPLSLDPGATVGDAFEALAHDYPQLMRFGRSLLIAVNQEYATRDQQLNDNDELAIFPPVSGGHEPVLSFDRDFFEITRDPIDVGTVARRVVLPECGATVSLDGYAREWTADRRTLHLVYEAYDEMALSEMRRL